MDRPVTWNPFPAGVRGGLAFLAGPDHFGGQEPQEGLVSSIPKNLLARPESPELSQEKREKEGTARAGNPASHRTVYTYPPFGEGWCMPFDGWFVLLMLLARRVNILHPFPPLEGGNSRNFFLGVFWGRPGV